MNTLASTTSSIEFKLAAPATTNESPWLSCWVDITGGTYAYAPSETDGTTNGSNPVTVVGAPGAGATRILNSFFLRNSDTAPIILTVQYNNNSTIRGIYSATLNPGDCVQYTDTRGFFVTSPAGLIKMVAA